MPIRLSGMNSGLDTDALVKELVSAYSLKTEKYEKQKTKVEWKKEAWQSLNTKIYGLYTNISNLQYDAAYNLKKTSVSDSTKAKVTAASSAVTGTQKLQVNKTAQSSYITGGKLGEDATSKTTLKELGYEGEATTIEVRTKAGDVKEINITKDSTISDIVTQMKDAGLNASFDEINGRFFVSAKESGTANDFDLCATDADSQKALTALGLNLSILEYDTENGKVVFSSAGGAYQEALDLKAKAGAKNQTIEQYLTDLIAGYKTDLAAQEAIIEANESIITTHEDLVAQRDAREGYDALYKAFTDAGIDLTKEQVYDLAKEFNSGSVKVDKLWDYLKEKNIELPEGKKVEDIEKILEDNEDNIKKVNAYKGDLPLEGEIVVTEEMETAYDQAVKDNKAAKAEIEKIKAKEYAEYVDIEPDKLQAEITKISTEFEERATEANKILTNATADTDGKITVSGEYAGILKDAAIKITGQDAEIVLNGAVYTSTTNSFSINGLTIEALGETNGEIAITTAVDTEGIYDKIKDFLTQYNSVINEIVKLYNADTAKGYEPLTDEERDAMSETEIEKWESKIKDSLLRRDTSLASIMNAMTNSMAQSIEINGKKLSLSSFGISTLGYLNASKNEQYAYHIDGDEDDSNTSGKENKLMKAIQENPDELVKFMKQLTSNLYTAIDGKMKSTQLSSVYKVYNDKEIDREIKSIEELIEKWKEKVDAEEERYYKQFSNMEVALSKLQSQTSSLTGLLGK